jgi:monothiol glutaredoxin
MELPTSIKKRITELIDNNSVVLFMKGSRATPQCGFSRQVVTILDSLIDDYEAVDVLADTELRETIKVFSDWPTFPQLYVDGTFIGGADIVGELFASGELQQLLKLPRQDTSLRDESQKEKTPCANL